MDIKKFLFFVLVFVSTGHGKVKPTKINLDSNQLMTAQDIRKRNLSNITITNGTHSTIASSGLFIAGVDVNDCSICTGNVIVGDNVNGLVQPVTFEGDQVLPVGQNYLYNMIYSGIYWIRTNSSSPCELPGCTWPGDITTTKWCLSLNLMSRHASYTHSNYVNGSYPASNAVPFGEAGSSNPFDYNYDLIDPNTLGIGNSCLGPIACDDQTLTCSVSTSQNQTFQSY